MEYSGRDIHHLPGRQRLAFFAKAHFAVSLDDEVNFFLLLVMPWNLPTIRIERDEPHCEVRWLNRCEPASEVLRAASGGVSTPLHFAEVGDDHKQAKNE